MGKSLYLNLQRDRENFECRSASIRVMAIWKSKLKQVPFPALKNSGVLQSVRLASLLLVLKLLVACSSQSPAEEITKEIQTVLSWAATAHMVGGAWARGAVPTAYAQQTLDKTQKQLAEETDTLSHLSADSKQRHTVLEHLQSLKSTVGQMSKSVEQKDYSAIALQLQQLATEQQQLNTLAHAGGQQ